VLAQISASAMAATRTRALRTRCAGTPAAAPNGPAPRASCLPARQARRAREPAEPEESEASEESGSRAVQSSGLPTAAGQVPMESRGRRLASFHELSTSSFCGWLSKAAHLQPAVRRLRVLGSPLSRFVRPASAGGRTWKRGRLPRALAFPFTQVEMREMWTYGDGVRTVKGYWWPSGGAGPGAGFWSTRGRERPGRGSGGRILTPVRPVDVFADVPGFPAIWDGYRA